VDSTSASAIIRAMADRGRISTEALVARCRAGDNQAWAELVERTSRYVYAIAVRAYRLSAQDAEDVFQEVYARTYEHLSRLRDDSAILPWLGQLTRRLCVDTLRSSARETPVEELESSGEVDDRLAEIDEALAVREALAAVPLHCQEVLDRFFCRDESYATIGAALDLPAGTIASRISRCLGRLREQLEGKKTPAGAV
jgi:RNA polymerase sigma factor (sigma-70 family)